MEVGIKQKRPCVQSKNLPYKAHVAIFFKTKYILIGFGHNTLLKPLKIWQAQKKGPADRTGYGQDRKNTSKLHSNLGSSGKGKKSFPSVSHS